MAQGSFLNVTCVQETLKGSGTFSPGEIIAHYTVSVLRIRIYILLCRLTA